MLATVANLAIVVAMCMAVMVGAISTEAPEASPAMADTIAEEEYMAGVAEDERPQLCTPNLEFLHPPLALRRHKGSNHTCARVTLHHGRGDHRCK